MALIVSIEERIALLESIKTRLISRTSTSELKSSVATRSTPTPYHSIKDGIYRIVQYSHPHVNEKPVEIDACVSNLPSDGGQDFSVKMEGRRDADKLSLWRINRAHGTEDGYFVIPYNNPGQDTDIGLTTYNDLERVYVTWSPTYLVWNILCNERLTFRKPTGTLEDKYYFRFAQIGTNKCWTTTENSEIRIEDINERCKHTQLYELQPLSSKEYLSLQSHQPIVLCSPDGNVHRKLWIATSPLSKADITRIDLVQLTTDSHDQGWADTPQQGVWTWFEICILSRSTTTDDFDEKCIKRDVDGSLLTYHSHTTYLSNAFKTQTGKLFSKDAEIWRHVEAGDSIGVLACAQYCEWMVEGRKVKLAFHELVPAKHA